MGVHEIVAVELVERKRQDQGARVVIGAVAFGIVGQVEGGMLQDAGRIGHAQQVGQVHRGQLRCPTKRFLLAGKFPLRAGFHIAPGPGFLEAFHVSFGHPRPGHIAAVNIGLPADGIGQAFILQQVEHAVRNGLRIAEGDQHAAPVCQQFLGIPVRRGDHLLSCPDGVGQCPGDDLRGVEIGCDVNIRGCDEVHQLFLAHKAVLEADMVCDVQVAGKAFQRFPVGLPMLLLDVRVGRPQRHIDRVGISLQDGRQGLDDIFQPLVGREQPEGEQDIFSLQPEFLLEQVRPCKRDVRDPVRDEIDLLLRHPVDLAQERDCPLAHHHQAAGQAAQFSHHRALFRVGVVEDGMQGGDERGLEVAPQGQDMASGRSPENAEFVLQADHIQILHI